MDFTKELQEKLDAVARIAGEMQDSASRAGTLTAEISEGARQLECCAGVILGHVSRWELWLRESESGQGREGAD